jgi:manganese/zinc/iron transport system permease protein
MLAIHLFQHEGLPEAVTECRPEHLQDHLRWDPSFARQVVRAATDRGLVVQRGELLALTDDGRVLAEQAMVH